MINLLPEPYKVQLRAARTNVLLIRYTIIVVLAFAFLALILIGAIFLLSQTRLSSEQLIAANDTKAAQFGDTSQEISRLTQSLSTSKQVLDQQISYSKVLQSVASLLPAGSVIGKIELTDESFDSAPTNLTVYAVDNETAVQVGQKFQTATGFRGAKIDSISETAGIEGYPVSATLTVSFARSVGQ